MFKTTKIFQSARHRDFILVTCIQCKWETQTLTAYICLIIQNVSEKFKDFFHFYSGREKWTRASNQKKSQVIFEPAESSHPENRQSWENYTAIHP